MERLKEISRIIDKVFNASLDFFKSKDTTKKILLTTDRVTSNSTDTKYLEILLKEELLNEKDIDLLTIEIEYQLNNGMINLKGEFYGSDGIILNEFNKRADIEDLDDIVQTATSFLEEIKSQYDEILKSSYNSFNYHMEEPIEKELNEVGHCFSVSENSFEELYKKCLKEITQVQFSKNRYYYIYPFENELNSQKRGRLLKTRPSIFKNVFEYGLNNEGKIIYVIEHISDTIKKVVLIKHTKEYLTAFTYVGKTHNLQNVTCVFNDENNQVSYVINWGLYGWRIDRFIYDEQGKLKQVERTSKEHQKERTTNSVFELSYDNGKLNAIVQQFTNGYTQRIFP